MRICNGIRVMWVNVWSLCDDMDVFYTRLMVAFCVVCLSRKDMST